MVLAKLGLDGHDRGIKVIARALSDAGMEVVYTGLRQTPEQVAYAALQEDADVVAVSILSGAHMTLVPDLVHHLRSLGAGDIPVVVGGIIPNEDVPVLKSAGVADVMGPGTPLSELVKRLKAVAKSERD